MDASREKVEGVVPFVSLEANAVFNNKAPVRRDKLTWISLAMVSERWGLTGKVVEVIRDGFQNDDHLG